jgi:hypothetical protein
LEDLAAVEKEEFITKAQSPVVQTPAAAAAALEGQETQAFLTTVELVQMAVPES